MGGIFADSGSWPGGGETSVFGRYRVGVGMKLGRYTTSSTYRTTPIPPCAPLPEFPY